MPQAETIHTIKGTLNRSGFCFCFSFLPLLLVLCFAQNQKQGQKREAKAKTGLIEKGNPPKGQ